jgi:hypothetical protein
MVIRRYSSFFQVMVLLSPWSIVCMVREVTSKVRFQLERRRRESGGVAHSS